MSRRSNNKKSLPDGPAGWYTDPHSHDRLRDSYLDGAHAPQIATVTESVGASGDVAATAEQTQPLWRSGPKGYVELVWSYARGWWKGWRNLFALSGRADRTEFWSFTLVNLGLLLGLYYVDLNLLGTPGKSGGLSTILYVLFLVTSVLAAIRRAHDSGHQGSDLIDFPGLHLLITLGEILLGPSVPPPRHVSDIPPPQIGARPSLPLAPRQD